MSSAWICAIPQCTDFIFWLDGRTSGFLYGRADYNMWLCSECVRQHWGKLQIKVLEILPEWQADLFSRHACPLERAVFLLWRSRKQVGVHRYLVPGTFVHQYLFQNFIIFRVRVVYGKDQAGRFSQADRARDDRSWNIFCFVFTFGFFILLYFSVVLYACICCVECRHSISHRSLVAPSILFYFLYALLLHLVPCCWRMYVVPLVSSKKCMSNRSFTRRHPARVHFGSCTEYYFFVFLHLFIFSSFFSFFVLSFNVFRSLMACVCCWTTQYDGMALRCLFCLRVLHDDVLSLCPSLWPQSFYLSRVMSMIRRTV